MSSSATNLRPGHLFTSLDVRGKTILKNRIVMAPMTTVSGETDGRFSRSEIDYLQRRAKSGVGMIITPACYCHKSGHSFDRQVGCHTEAMLGRLSRCAEAINTAGAASFLQIHHGGNAAKERLSGMRPWAPSAVHNRRNTSELPRAMTGTQIQELVESFARAAGRARRAGFTGVELHGANTYLFQQFFSPFTNKRTDSYSVDVWENRTRFSREVVEAVRREVGPDYPLAYRISPEEEDPDGYSTIAAARLLVLLVECGVDMVHVSSWEYGSGLRNDLPSKVHPTTYIKSRMPADIPVIGVGGISVPAQAEAALVEGVDLVALGKALLLDGEWAKKALEGRSAEIRTQVTSRHDIARLDIPEPMKEYVTRFFLPD